MRHFILKPLVVLIAIAVIATVALDLPHTSELNEVNSSRENANLRNGTTEIESKILSSEDTGPQIFEHHWSEKSEENSPTLPDSRNKDTSSGGFISPIIQQTSIASSSSGLTPREPILIDGNESFTAANGVTSGSGTENDPYIIENWDIRAENGSGIEIRNTTAHFIIRNCYVHDGWHGIWFYNVINGKIDNNLLENLYCGIALWYRFTNNNLVSNNVLKKTGEMGILSFLSENNTIENNLVENVVSTGLQSGAIYAVSGRNTVISKNIIRNSNSIGISLDSETLGFEIDNNLISNNIVENCAYGIKLWSSTLPWWKGPRKNKIDNNIVKGNVFGIYIEYSDKNLILNNTVENNQQGIYIKNSENNLASNNIVENGNYGIRIDNSFNSKIDNNLMKSCTYSIFIENSVNNTVENNVVENNSYGIHLYYSPKNSISHNTIRNNSNYAIYLDISSVLTIERNLIKNNYCGIYLWYSHFNTIRYNTVENNSHGIELRYYSANFIYHNNFTSNANQAYDDSATGYWDNGYPSGGNFWNDYTGEDNYHGKNQNILGSDGIGDTPYYIPGDNNRDRYPLMSPIAGAYTGEVLQGTTVVNGRAETDTEVVITSSQEEGFVTMVKYKGNPGGPPPDNLKVLGKFVEVRTDIPSENVVWPIEIRIYYTDNEVAEAGISENSLRIFYWNGCEWVQEENSGVDIENNYVWARVTHLSPFTPLEGIIRGVEVSISPSYQSGLPGSTLNYTITVTNTGNVEDNCTLSAMDNLGWPLTITPTMLTIPAGENKTATLSVEIPDNVPAYAINTITVTAISQADPAVSDSDSCTAQVAPGIYPSDDSLVDEDLSLRTYNYGSKPSFDIDARNGGIRRSFLKFDLSVLPENAMITSAKLKLYCWGGAYGTKPDMSWGLKGLNVEVRKVENDNWSENTLIWLNQPAFGDLISAAFVDNDYSWYEWDVTSFVQAEFAGDKIVSLVIKPENEGFTNYTWSLTFRSKDYWNLTLHPYLEIEYVEVSTTLEPMSCEFLLINENKTHCVFSNGTDITVPGLSYNFTVTVKDQYGNPLANAPVSWSLEGDSNFTLDWYENLTDTNGIAKAQVSATSHYYNATASLFASSYGATDSVNLTKIVGCVNIKVIYEDGTPIAGAELIVINPAMEIVGWGFTNEEGRISFCNTPKITPDSEYYTEARELLGQCIGGTFFSTNKYCSADVTIVNGTHCYL